MFNTYEELQKAVEERRKDTLCLEIDMGGSYSIEHEEAKRDLQQAQALKTLAGEQGFLSDNIDSLKKRVEDTKPPSQSIFIRFKRIKLNDWADLMKQQNLSPIDQYEKVLPKTFVGIFGTDDPDAEALSTDYALVSTKGDKGIIPGGALNQVIMEFMSWQNRGDAVSIHPTK